LKDTEGKSEKNETAYFTGNGLMLDCSRNAVFTVEKSKRDDPHSGKAGAEQAVALHRGYL